MITEHKCFILFIYILFHKKVNYAMYLSSSRRHGYTRLDSFGYEAVIHREIIGFSLATYAGSQHRTRQASELINGPSK